jgi:prevent-host-death family protein
MSRAISASEANQNFSKLLREVGRGETFVVMSRGRAVAKVVPVDAPDTAQPVDELLSWLDALPRRDAGRLTRDDLYP